MSAGLILFVVFCISLVSCMYVPVTFAGVYIEGGTAVRVTGQLKFNGKDYTIGGDTLAGKDFSEMVGKKVKVIGIQTHGQKGESILQVTDIVEVP